MAEKLRSFLFFPIVIVTCAMIGGIYGPGVSGVAAASSEDDINNSVKTFSKVFELVENNFADQVNADKAIYKGAISGMLHTLDPHSNFFDVRDFQQLRDDQKGHYSGVGMTVAERNHRTVVIQPFPGSPAYKAGIRPGDVILEVQDKRTDNLNTTEVADLLRGQRGTKVQVLIAREGVEKPIVYNLTRDDIPRKSVQDVFWVREGIAYLDIESFNENTSHEVEDNMKRIGENKVKALILDLRENPGGLLNEGVAVAGRFLANGQTVVSHRGRASAEKPYIARHGGGARDYPIIVLVNRYSASAAEIVAGALQDHDRAWVVGENTFGKGLVQTVFPLSENTGLALTTAKYYTPSNRLIQRDYTNTSFLDYYYRKDTETKNPLDVKMTDSGRTVYGGGGISPDEKFSVPRYNKYQTEFVRKFVTFNFTAKYFGGGDAKLPKDWSPDKNVMNDLHSFMLKEGIQFSEADFAENIDWTKMQLKREMYLTAFGAEDARRLGVESDPVVIKGIDSIPKAKELLDKAKKMIVERRSTEFKR